jgi:transposase
LEEFYMSGADKNKFKNTFYVTVYICAKEGMNNSQIAGVLGVREKTFRTWIDQKEGIEDALQRGREKVSQGDSALEMFNSYVYGRLPDHLKDLWERIKAVEQEKNGIQRMEALLTEAGKYARMHLFLYAYVTKNFNVAKACRAVNISRSTFEKWVAEEPKFPEIMDEMMKAKGDFIEGALFKLIKKGEPAAVLFASRTFNKARGYADKTEVEVTGLVHHSMIDLEKLDLPVATLRVVLDAIRRQRLAQAKPPALDYANKNGRKIPALIEESEDAEFELKNKEEENE